LATDDFKYALVDKDINEKVNGFYYIKDSCIKYFDYQKYLNNIKNYGI